MAVIVPTISDGPEIIITWATITTSDTGAAVDISKLQDITIHVVGSGTAQMQRSNDGTNFVSWGSALAANTVNDQGATPTSAKFLKISAVASATVTVILTARKHK